MTYAIRVTNDLTPRYDKALTIIENGFKLTLNGHMTIKPEESIMSNKKFHILINDYMKVGDTLIFYDFLEVVRTLDEAIFLIELLKTNEFNFVDLTNLDANTFKYTREFLYNQLSNHFKLVQEYLQVLRGIQPEGTYAGAKHLIPCILPYLESILTRENVTPTENTSLQYNKHGIHLTGTKDDLYQYVELRSSRLAV